METNSSPFARRLLWYILIGISLYWFTSVFVVFLWLISKVLGLVAMLLTTVLWGYMSYYCLKHAPRDEWNKDTFSMSLSFLFTAIIQDYILYVVIRGVPDELYEFTTFLAYGLVFLMPIFIRFVLLIRYKLKDVLVVSNTKLLVTATIGIAGSAALQDSVTQSVAGGMGCPESSMEECPSTVTMSWRVCCTGPGAVTITVTPYGEYYDYVTYIPEIFVQPVYAASMGYIPLPSDHLISDSITITQVAQKTSEPASSWSLPHNIRTTNVWTQPQTQLAGQSVTIYANLANRGDIEGPYTATLKINGNEKAVKTGMLQGNTAVPLEFVVNCDEPGTYTVDVNGKQTFYTVVGDTEKEGASLQNSQKLLLLWGFLLLALILALVMIILRRRQSYE